MIDPHAQSPNFAELVNERIAEAYGAKIQLPKGVFFDLDPRILSQSFRAGARKTPTQNLNPRSPLRSWKPSIEIGSKPEKMTSPPNRPPAYSTQAPAVHIGALAEPLSGDRVTTLLKKLAPDVLKNPQNKLPEDGCCFC